MVIVAIFRRNGTETAINIYNVTQLHSLAAHFMFRIRACSAVARNSCLDRVTSRTHHIL